MIKKSSERPSRKIEVDLAGPEGNAFMLLGMAKRWATDLGLNWEEIKAEATSGDYKNLVSVLDREFGNYVTFYMADKDEDEDEDD